MSGRIVVPLDGSVLAEKALPYAIRLAQELKAELLLIKVVQTGTLVSETVTHEIEVLDAATQYLKNVRQIISNLAYTSAIPREQVHIRAIYGEAVNRLVDLIPFEKADLVVMTTHARTGLSRLALGSVATELVRRLDQPVILIRPDAAEVNLPLEEIMRQTKPSEINSPRQLLVTLDGSPEAEVVLKPAVNLARWLQAALYLLRVEHFYTPGDYALLTTYYAGYDVPELAKENQKLRIEAYRYLDEIQKGLTEPSLEIITKVQAGEPAVEIASYARQIKANLMVMATHARGRLGHALLGSVAEEVLRTSHIPIMMLHTGLPVSIADKTIRVLVN
jgi:nucleotide-binding universal stress UspA family protein